MQYKRAKRVGHLIQEEISELLLREVKDPRLRFITITEVQVSDDLRHARVYFSVHGNEKGQALEGLRRAAGFLRGVLGRRLHLRYAPELSFFIDESLDHGLHISQILRKLQEGETHD